MFVRMYNVGSNYVAGNLVLKFHLSLMQVNLKFKIRDFEPSLFEIPLP